MVYIALDMAIAESERGVAGALVRIDNT